MLVIVTYDVETSTPEGSRRLRRVARECVNYGHRVQASVFECVLNDAQFVILRNKLTSIIDESADSIRFYFMGNNWSGHIETIGLDHTLNIDSPLIV